MGAARARSIWHGSLASLGIGCVRSSIHIHGWSVRIRRLEYTQTIEPIHTLGDLRRTTDAQLLREPNVGKKMLAELRRFCPHRNPAYGGKRYYKRGSLSAKLKRREA
jgi:hypothetical protein